MQNPFLGKLKSKTKALYNTTSFLLYSFHLKYYFEFLKSNLEVAVLFDNLNSKYSESISKSQDLFDFPYGTEGETFSKINYTRQNFLNSINGYEEWVCLCFNYLSQFNAKRPNLRNLTAFVTPTYNANYKESEEIINQIQNTTDLELVNLILNEFIEPISTFIEFKIGNSKDYLFLRYKIFCEFYDKTNFDRELDITEHHLPKFLFHEGVDINLTEAHLPSNEEKKKHIRIDNFFIDKGNNYLAESKIFKSRFTKGPLDTLKRQIHQRLEIIGHKIDNIGYGLIFSKTEHFLKIEEYFSQQHLIQNEFGFWVQKQNQYTIKYLIIQYWDK